LETVQRSTGGFLSPSFLAGNHTVGPEVNLIWGGVLGGTIGGGGSLELFPIIGQTPFPNVVSDDYGTISGGANNLVGNTNLDFTDSIYATIGGGYQNVAGGPSSTIAGGSGNIATGAYSAIGGGGNNTNTGYAGVVGGGVLNTASAETAVVAGGNGNVASGIRAFIGGGEANIATNFNTVIGGGFANTNYGISATIAGGQYNFATNGGATIGGGELNTAGGVDSTVAGGSGNIASGSDSTAGGGAGNTASGYAGTVGGGVSNQATNLYSTVGGGFGNFAYGYGSTVPGGFGNIARGSYSFAAGQQAIAINPGCFVWADSLNTTFSSTANDQFLIRAQSGVGINNNFPQASLDVSGTVRFEGVNGWDVNNTDGDFRIGGGTYRFKVGIATNGGGAGDVWMRAQGGTARVFLKTPGGTTIYSNEGQTTGVSLAAGGGSWANLSDRNSKENFVAVDAQEILERLTSLPVSTWNYKSQEKTIRHLGPMAQDFAAAFQVGEDDRHITTIDAEGVALAAIKGLNEKMESENAALRAENAELKSRLDKIERLLSFKETAAR
jgi:hypothetical protein